jgi:iron complex outermembrane receptor protein
MSYKRTTLAVALAALPFALHAADTAFSTVVVTATKEDTAATSVDATSLQTGRATTSDTASLLKDVPGVSLYGAGGVSSLPAIHGLADDRLRIKVDGMDLISSCANHMNPALSYIDPTNVGSIKVYVGITPVSAGGDSIGGSIVVNSPAPVFAEPGHPNLLKGEAGAFYRSNGGAKGGNISATLATDSFSVTYAAATAGSNNYKAAGDFKTLTATSRDTGRTIPLDEVGGSAYETNNQSVGFALRGGNHLVEFKYANQAIPFQYFPNQRMDMTQNDATSFNLSYTGQYQWGALKARAYQETTRHEMGFAEYKTSSQMPMDTKGKTTGLSLNADITLSPQEILRVGGEYQTYRLDDWWRPVALTGMGPGTFWNINDGQRDRTAIFGELEKQLSPKWLTLLGARYEQVKTNAGDVRSYDTTVAARQNEAVAFNAQSRDKTDNNWDLTALARYTPSTTQDIEFGFARKVRSPNLYERYSWSTWQMAAAMINTVGDGNGYVGDINLKPEKAHALSATFDWHAADRSSEFKATPFYTRVTDYIDAVAVGVTAANTNAFTSNTFNVLRYANQSARLYGIDLSGKLPLAKTGFGDLGLKGLLNYTNGKNLDTGDELYNIMPLNTKLTLTQQYGNWDNAIELVAVKAKNNISDVRNEIKTPGYSLINLRGSYSWKQTRVDFGIENLFDKFYSLPTGGAYVGQGSTMALRPANMPWGIALPGQGRSLYAGVNYKF